MPLKMRMPRVIVPRVDADARKVIRAAVLVAACALLLAGCGGSSFEAGTCAPSTPRIDAHRTHERIVVAYELRKGGCDPWAIHVTAHSVDKLDNIAPGKGAGGPVPLRGERGTIELKLPPLDLPPYEALASTVTRTGRRSETVKVRIPESGDYCRRSQSAGICIARAQAKFMRCLRGAAPRSACPDYVWNARPLIRYEPTRGVTRSGLERSFAYMAERAGSNPPLASVSCGSLRWCVATWRGPGRVFRARYEISGYGQRDGCWIGERRAILRETRPRYEHEAPLRHVISERTSACVDWVQ
jgi:hypothetical protein